MPYVRTRLGRWFYEERGASRRPRDPSIVLLHGLLFDGRMWKHQLEPLSALGRVIVLDGPGHGRSEAPPRFSLEDHADAMLDVLAELAVERGAFVGLSWGGMVAMRMALQHAERVAALGLLDTSAEDETAARRVRYRLFTAFARRFGLPPLLVEREILPMMFSPRFRREEPDVVASFVRAAKGFDLDGAARAALAVLVKRTSVADKLPHIHHPTLVMCGSEDVATPSEESERIARSIPGAKLVRLEGAGHMSSIEQPDAVSQELVAFLRPLFE
jgi:3-oxoadipate enol-lactonase